eukprot:4352753-Alexandrium_andersonii.AAC.1
MRRTSGVPLDAKTRRALGACAAPPGARLGAARLPVGCGVRLGHQRRGQRDCSLGAAFASGTSATG